MLLELERARCARRSRDTPESFVYFRFVSVSVHVVLPRPGSSSRRAQEHAEEGRRWSRARKYNEYS